MIVYVKYSNHKEDTFRNIVRVELWPTEVDIVGQGRTVTFPCRDIISIRVIESAGG